MRERLDMPEGLLLACLREQYNLSASALELAHVGWDSMAVAYRIVSAQGEPLLLRAKLGSFYEPSCLVPRSLHDQGIAAVVAPLRTKRNALWTRIEGGEWGDWVVTVLPFMEGDIGWHPSLTDAQWRAIGTTLRQIHQAPLPSEGIQPLRRETFEPTAYDRQARTFDAHFAAHADGGSQSEHMLRSLWLEHQSAIHRMLAAMNILAKVLQGRAGPFVICHADLHPGNMIRDYAGHVHVIDWDDVMLALKERDFLFVADPPAEGAPGNGTLPFFQGYGPTEIDWVALTYYRFERVVTDLLECAQEVVFRDDLGEVARAEAAQLFGEVLEPGGMGDMVAAAWAAASRIPVDLSISGGAAS